jgi:hypothetical protein
MLRIGTPVADMQTEVALRPYRNLEASMNISIFRMTAIAMAAAAAAGCASTRTTQHTASEPVSTPQVTQASLPPGAEVPLLGPADAKPGECYARVFNAAKYETRPEQVLKTAASERVDIVPAKTEQVQQQVVVKPATTRIEYVPPVYETVQEQVLVEPEHTVLEQVPAQYETVTEQVMVKPAVRAWKKASEGASSSTTKVDTATGEVLCLVETPAQYETVTKQVVKTPATTRERVVAPVYKTVERQVVKTPATTREVQVPAEYAPVMVTKVVEPAREQRVQLPAQYETVQRTVLAEPAKEEWRQVLCNANTDAEQMRKLQDALRNAGYDPGPSTGTLNAQTEAALRQYQQAHNLPVDRGDYVNLKTAQALGVGSASATAERDIQTGAGSDNAAAATGEASGDQVNNGAADQSNMGRPGDQSGSAPGNDNAGINGTAGSNQQ